MRAVDVIIPTHNCIYIAEAIESVLNQTYKNLQVIVIDDGSNDNTSELIQAFLKKFPDKISYYYQEQQGPAAARNTGIKKSSNEYIAFLDADDIWLPDKIEKQLEVFNQNPDIGFVYCDNYFIDKNEKIIKDYVRKVKLVEGDILLDFFMDFFLITSGIILKRICLKKTGLFDEALEVGEDFDFFLRLAKNFRAGVVKKKLYFRRVWLSSLSKQNFELNRIIDIQTLIRFIKKNPSFYNKNVNKIKKRFSEFFINFGYDYLDNGNNFKALKSFISAYKYNWKSFKIKFIFVCLLPINIRRMLKKYYGK